MGGQNFCVPHCSKTQYSSSDINDIKTHICDESEGVIETIIGNPEEEEIKNN